MINNSISILIPTYNRASTLNDQLSYLIDLLKSTNSRIIISDNCSTDNTRDVVSKWKKKYDNITYFIQDENVGYDRNVFKCMSLVVSDYFWLLGDSTIITEAEFNEISRILNSDLPNAILINAYNKIKKINSRYYNDANSILYDLGWNITNLSSLIISKDAILTQYFERYFDTNFLHLGLFFEYIVNVKNLKVFYYHKNPLIHSAVFSTNLNRSSWANDKYEIFCKDWFFFVMSLPNQIKKETKLKCIKDHSNYTSLFSYERILRDRAKNYIDKKRFKEVEMFFPFVSDTSILYVKILNYIPVRFYEILKRYISHSNIS